MRFTFAHNNFNVLDLVDILPGLKAVVLRPDG